MRYSEGFKASIVKKTQDGSGQSLYRIARETGINTSTIKNWIAQYENGRLGLDGSDSISPSERSPGEKLALLLESRTIAEDVKGEWLRTHGLHSEHLPLWEQELASIMNDKQTDLKAENAGLKKENKELKKEKKRQDKALAELAILISLKEKSTRICSRRTRKTSTTIHPQGGPWVCRRSDIQGHLRAKDV